VDVNIAARVAEAANAGEVLVSGTACERLDATKFELGRSRRLGATGAPKELSVCTVNEPA
jgi:class 3 adenylate cyclase